MNVFQEQRIVMLGKLTAGGGSAGPMATVDPAASPPFVLVGLVTTVATEGIGAWASTVPVTIAVPPPGDANAALALEELLEEVYGALGFAPARPGPYTGGDGKPLPSYALIYPVSIPNPAC